MVNLANVMNNLMPQIGHNADGKYVSFNRNYEDWTITYFQSVIIPKILGKHKSFDSHVIAVTCVKAETMVAF